MNGLTQTDSDNLADIIWFIKGYTTAQKLNDTATYADLCDDHIQSLRKFRNALTDYQEQQKHQRKADLVNVPHI